MRLCWKVFLPISLSFVLVTFSLLWCFNGVL
jgi:NADH:ubiquinone oxidoreductase subunit H